MNATLKDPGESTLLRGTLRHNESLARHTSWRVGGPATSYYRPADIDDLSVFLNQLPPAEPVFWLGLGSNLLVRDGGIQGTVIATGGMLNGLERLDAQTLRAEAGVSCAKVARHAARLGLSGGEFFAGIPGTVGGALAMNAGAFGAETWEHISRVETIDHRGQRRLRMPNEYRIAYRSVFGPLSKPGSEWFVAGHLQFQLGDSAAAKRHIRKLLTRRNDTQPTQQANAGSVFRNPPGDHAARLIEGCGLKGLCIGGACVSEKHANFIINQGLATAAEIETLIGKVAARVEQRYGIQLTTEVLIVGEEASSS